MAETKWIFSQEGFFGKRNKTILANNFCGIFDLLNLNLKLCKNQINNIEYSIRDIINQKYRQTNIGQTNIQTDKWLDRQMVGQTDRQTDKEIETARQLGKKMERQSDRNTERDKDSNTKWLKDSQTERQRKRESDWKREKRQKDKKTERWKTERQKHKLIVLNLILIFVFDITNFIHILFSATFFTKIK